VLEVNAGPQNAARAIRREGEPPAGEGSKSLLGHGQVLVQLFQATQFGSALHALWIDAAQGPGPPSAAACAGPLRHVMQAVSGAAGVAAHAVDAQAVAQGPGVAEVPQPQVTSALTNVS
jgi:hypothetical protein